MRLVCLGLLAAVFPGAAESGLELRGQLADSGRPIMVTLFGADSPYTASALTDLQGRFRFRSLTPGSYTVAVFLPGHKELRRTVVVSPALAQPNGSVQVNLPSAEESLDSTDHRAGTISVGRLSIPPRALRKHEEAQKHLSKRDVERARQSLKEAVQIAPQFMAAWNSLGVIAYQTRQYPAAEEHFRAALKAEPGAYEPTVNLGGVLLNLNRPAEALSYNQYAVLQHPGDALAHSQLGMTYFQLGNLDRAEHHLTTARRIDPSHFSQPQLLLSQIHLRRGDSKAAVQEWQEYLARYPDAPGAEQVRHWIHQLTTRSEAQRPQ